MNQLTILIMSKLHFAEKHKNMISEVLPSADIFIAKNAEEAGESIEKADIILASNWDFNREIYSKAKNLKWVHAVSAGVENMLFPEMVKSQVLLSNARGIFDTPAAEHTMALILSFSRGIGEAVCHQEDKKWRRYSVVDLQGSTLGIVGLGSIGREIARIAKHGFNMRVIATKKRITSEPDVDCLYPVAEQDTLLKESDFIVIAAASTPETEGLIGEQELRLMKKNAVLINIARGKIVKENDLINALKQGWVAGAGLDVFEKEPLSHQSELYELDNVVLTPHRAGFTYHNLNDERIENFCENLQDFLSGKQLRTQVDKQAKY